MCALVNAESLAEIAGGPDKFIKSGSTLELRCDFIDSTTEPDYIFWYQASVHIFSPIFIAIFYCDLAALFHHTRRGQEPITSFIR